MPRPNWADRDGKYDSGKKSINKALTRHLKYFKHTAQLNIDVVRPENGHLFDNRERLSAQGYYKFWSFVDQTFQLLDNLGQLRSTQSQLPPQ